MDIKINPIYWRNKNGTMTVVGATIKSKNTGDIDELSHWLRDIKDWRISYVSSDLIRLQKPMPTDDMSKKDFMVKSAMDHFSNELSGMIERHQKEGFELLYSFRKEVREAYDE